VTGVESARALAGGLLAFAPPAVALARHLARGMRPTERVLIGLALAPFALIVPALLLMRFAHEPLKVSFWQSEFLWVVASLWLTGPAKTDGREPFPERGHGFPAILALAGAFAVACLVVAAAFAVPMLRMRGGAWYETAVAIQIVDHGLPPRDPYFAGIPLYHAWFRHLLLAMLSELSGASLFHVQAVLAGWAALVMSLASAHLAYRAFGRAAAAVAGPVALLGLNPLGWIVWAMRPASDAVHRLMSLAGAEAAPRALAAGFAPESASMLVRFWSGSATAPALALGVVLAWSVMRALERPSRSAFLRGALLAAATIVFDPAVAALALGALALGLGLAALRGRRGAAFAAWLALGAGLLVTWPYLASVVVPGALGLPRPGFASATAWTLLVAIGPWWLAALPAAVAAWRQDAGARLLAGAAAGACVVALVFAIPATFADLAPAVTWLAVAPLAAGGLVGGMERLRLPFPARVALGAALLLPTSGLIAIGMAGEGRSPRVLIHGDRPGVGALPLETAEEEKTSWLLRETPADAAVIEPPRPSDDDAAPVLARRAAFAGPLETALARTYGLGPTRSRALMGLREEAGVRRMIQRRLFQAEDLEPAEELYLSNFATPVLLVMRRDEVPPAVWSGLRPRPEWGELMSNPEVRVYRYEGIPRDTSRVDRP